MGRKSTFRHPRYHVVRLLAEGGMGKVYLARDRLEDDRQVALKVYPARYYHDRLRDEFVALKELHHPGIARALHFGLLDGASTPFFTLEYICGEPLDRHAVETASGRNAPRLDLLLEATAAVAYLHRRGVIHLDLKPDNILVVEGSPGAAPRAVLIDFGLVRAVKAPAKLLGHATLPYAPPEAFTGDPPSRASDVYSLAATFYRTLSGRLPVQGSDFASFARAHRTGAAAPIPETAPAVERVLLRALAKDPRRRFHDASEMHRALAQALAPALAPASPEARAVAPRRVEYHEPDFVGRGVEVKAFTRWLESDRVARPVFEVIGGSGWGKTRLLERIETLLETRGKTALRLCAGRHRGQGLAEDIEHSASILASTPRIRRPPNASDDATAIRRLALHRLLPLLRSGTFLLIDDLHAASPADQALVGDAAVALRDGPASTGGIIVSRTPRDTGTSREPAPCLSELSMCVELGPLALDEALQIDLEGLDGAPALSRFSAERTRSLKKKLHEASGGHPLFFVRGLLDLAGDPDGAVRVAPIDRAVSQVERLAPTDRRALAVISLLERPASVTEIAGMLGVANALAEAAVARLRGLGLLGRSGVAVRAIHESVARAATSGLSTDEVSSLHAAIASFLARGVEPDGHGEAAWHFFEAGDTTAGLRSAEACLAPGGLLRGSAGGRLAQALERAAEAERPGTPRGRRFLEAASDALDAQGRFEECAAVRQRILDGVDERAGALDADAVRRRRKLGAACHRAGRLDLALEHLNACVSAAAEESAGVESLRARADLALLHHFRGETDLALEHSRRGIASWNRSTAANKRATIQCAVNFHAVLGQVRIRRLELDDATRVLEAGLRLARRTRSSSNTALLLNNLALAHHLSGRLDAALATFARAAAVAKELEDAAALVSIRANEAQIHARKGRFVLARALLDEIEESPAVKQSKRLRLYCSYTRGLLSSLLGGDTHDLWARVESMAAEAGDALLGRFAKIYRAESLIASGRLSEARALLDRESDPMLESPRLARLALIESLAGRKKEAAAALGRLERSCAAPPLLDAWNKLYVGLAALADGRTAKTVKILEDARKTFHATGFAVGELECALILADAHLRDAGALEDTAANRCLLRAEREIERARGVAIDAPGDASPRSRDLRTTLLEARLALERLSRRRNAGNAPGGEGPAAGDATLGAALRDLLARAAGDPSLGSSAEQRLLLEILRSGAARLEGDVERSRTADAQAAACHAESAALLTPDDRKRHAAIDPWSRLGLERFRPPRGEPTLEARHADALAALLRAAEAMDGDDRAGALLEGIGAATGARRVELEVDGGTIAEWTREGDARAEARRGDAGRPGALAARLRCHGIPVGWLRIAASSKGCFEACDEAFLDAAARAIAPHILAPDVVRRAAEADRTRALEPPVDGAARPRRKSAIAATSPLARTHRLASAASKTESIARTLRAEGVIATGREMSKVACACAALAVTDLPVLITGDSGTGKNLIAHGIHRLSARAAGPFIAQHSSAVPPELFEADLFGYERGAFTGAENTRTGFLFQAAGGTFHLEEVGDLDLALQQLLLRVIEERIVRPLGSTSERRLDVRFVTSTQRDLEVMVRRGQFRKDLYYRLNGARIHLPSLSERKDDIADLVEHHWRALTGSTSRFPTAALEVLRSHDWPGNVRELVSVLRRLSLDTAGAPGTTDVRAALGQREARGLFPPSLFESHSFDEVTRKLEKSYLEHLFEKHAGNLEDIAAVLETTTRSIYRRFERLGMKPRDLKSPR